MNRAATDVGLAIFAKTPGHSPVKTRLAAAWSEGAARQFHLHSAAAVAAVARAAQTAMPGLTPHWAVAEEEALDDPLWQTLPRLNQGPDDLGARMRRVYQLVMAKYGRALLLGADAPQVQVSDLSQAVDALDSHDYVLGPSVDGGFWLFGGRAQVPDMAWDSTPWSCSDTAERFVAGLRSGSVARLRTLRDVDTADDVPPLLAALDALPHPRPEQRRLQYWLLRDSAPKS